MFSIRSAMEKNIHGHKYACPHSVDKQVHRLTSLPQNDHSRSKQNYVNAVNKPEQYCQLGRKAVLSRSNTSMLRWNLHLKYLRVILFFYPEEKVSTSL